MLQRIDELRKDFSVIPFRVLLPLPKTKPHAPVRILGFKKQHLIHESGLLFKRRENFVSPCRLEFFFLASFKRPFDDEGVHVTSPFWSIDHGDPWTLLGGLLTHPPF